MLVVYSYIFLNLFFMAVCKKIIWAAIIKGIIGIFQLIFIQLIFIKNKMIDVRTPAVKIMALGLVTIELFLFIKFIFGANDCISLSVFIVGF
jgi:hypothetical protein